MSPGDHVPTPVTRVELCAIIVNYRTPELVAINLAALANERLALPGLRVLVVDGGSGDGSAEQIARYIKEAGLEDWVESRPLAVNGGFGWANNHAIREVMRREPCPDYIYLLNPDAVIRHGAIEGLVAALEQDAAAGAVGSRLLDADGTVLGSAFRFPTPAGEFGRGADTGGLNRLLRLRPQRVDPPALGRVDWVTGASVLLRPAALRAAGVFDEGFFLYFEEVELMHRMRKAGWFTLHEPRSEVVHVGGASTGVGTAGQPPRAMPAYWFRSRLRYFARTHGFAGALLANLAWLAGKSLWELRVLIGKAPAGRQPPGEVAGVLSAGLWPQRHDLVPHGTALEQTETRPAWLNRP